MILSLLIKISVETAKIQGGAGPVLTKQCVGSDVLEGRAAQCAAPTDWNGLLTAGDRKGRPYGESGSGIFLS